MRTTKKKSDNMEKFSRGLMPPIPHLSYTEVQQLTHHLLDLVNDNHPDRAIPEANEVYSLALMAMGLVGFTTEEYRRVVNMHHAHIRLILHIDKLMSRLSELEEALEERGLIA